MDEPIGVAIGADRYDLGREVAMPCRLEQGPEVGAAPRDEDDEVQHPESILAALRPRRASASGASPGDGIR